ncbi:MAG: exodeoxyribonuclease V subunit gamma [Bacteroidota bacterium]
MLYRFSAHDKYQLVQQLADCLAEVTLNPLNPEWMIVQNREIKQWIHTQLATIHGVSANVTFSFPDELTWKLYRFIHPELPKRLPSDRDAMELQIFDILTTNSDWCTRITGINRAEISEMDVLPLARSVADVFDQYQFFRPHWLKQWKQGKRNTPFPEERWQQSLWELLNHHFNGQPARSDAFSTLLQPDVLQALIPHLPKRLFVFGLSTFSGSFIRLIEALSGILDVFIFDDWSTTSVSAPLAVDWRAPQKDLNKVLAGIPHAYTILDDTQHRASVFPPEIHVHSCHSIKREVEVLWDQCLGMLEDDRQCEPTDLLILVPDIDTYAPYLSAPPKELKDDVFLFGWKDSTVMDALKHVIHFLTSEHKANDCMDILRIPFVGSSFGISTVEIELISQWMMKFQTRRGVEPDEWNVSSFYQLLKNLYFGYALDVSDTVVWDAFPDVNISNNDQLVVLGRLSSFIRSIRDNIQFLDRKRSFSEWVDWIRNIALHFIGDTDHAKTQELYRVIERLQAVSSHLEQNITFETAWKWMDPWLTQKGASSFGMNRGITISTYIPIRGLPYKAVFLLGFNEETFPRKPDRPSFDLISRNPLPGDRIQQADDRLWFSELLMHTDTQLHISYIGQNLYSDDESLPSVLIDELKWNKQDGQFRLIEHKHPRTGLNPAYFTSDEFFSFDTHRASLSSRIAHLPEEVPGFFDDVYSLELPELITPDELARFFVQPFKWMLNTHFNVAEGYDQLRLEDRELFELHALNRYRLSANLLDAHSADDELRAELARKFALSGILPTGFVGEHYLAEVAKSIEPLHALFHEFDQVEQVDVDIPLGTLLCKGPIYGVIESKRMVIQPGRLKPEHMVQAWVLLLLASTRGVNQTVLYSLENVSGSGKKGSKRAKKTTLNLPDEPDVHVNDILKWFIDAHQRKAWLSLDHTESMALAEAEIKGKAYTKGEVGTRQSSSFSVTKTDLFTILATSFGIGVQHPSFREISTEFWTPLLENKSEEWV